MYDLNAMRAHGRTLIRDPSGDACTDNDWRDMYLNPAYQEWWRRFEERPGFGSLGQLINPGTRAVGLVVSGGVFNEAVHYLTISQTSTPTVELSMRRSERNRIRDLQETEGRTAIPREWAVTTFQVGAVATQEFAFYPIPDIQYLINVYSKPPIQLLGLGGDSVLLDPASARAVTRIAAHRLANDLKLPLRLINDIAATLPEWVKARFNIEYQTQHKTIDKEEVAGFPRFQTVEA